MSSVSKVLIDALRAQGTQVVFGIPGVHTVELYRGLAKSGLRHVTPRHEQGAGFMADGYARVSGQAGVAFVITGPGLTNTLTPMAQARADSIPMIVISGANTVASFGQGWGHLHELPDQLALAKQVALYSQQITDPVTAGHTIEDVLKAVHSGRPGPVHLQIPLDVAPVETGTKTTANSAMVQRPVIPIDPDQLQASFDLLQGKKQIVILAGGGAKNIDDLAKLAERLDAPVVQTVNARGVMFDHPLSVPASPSLNSVRDLISQADCVLALGTELGQTDYDMFATDTMPDMANLIRVDLCAEQLGRHRATLAIQGCAAQFTAQFLQGFRPQATPTQGAARAKHTRMAAWQEIGPDYQAQVEILNALRDMRPNTIFVGDSTQLIYAGNLYYDHDRPAGWFNAATGYGALGYGIPAAIGAAIAKPEAHVLCITGDGGAQFSIAELMTAVDENLAITFLVWNNRGYKEIELSMQAAGVDVLGCDPTPPDFAAVAQSFGIPFQRVDQSVASVCAAYGSVPQSGPSMIEVVIPDA